MTLIELLLAMAISVIIFGVVTAAFTMAVRLNESTRVQLAESHDSQLTAAYLPADLISAGTGAPETTEGLDSACATTPTGLNVLRLRWSETEGASTRNYVASYRVHFASPEWQLIRVACSALAPASTSTSTPTIQVVARNLRPVLTPGDRPSVTISGAKVTITVTDASGYTYALTGTRRTTAAAAVTPTTSPTPSPSPTVLPPVISAVQLVGDAAGEVFIDVTFSEPVPSACASQFSLTGLPITRGTYTGPATLNSSGDVARLTIDRGSNAPNTAVDGLKLSFSGETSSCPASSVSNASPVDKAAPVLVNFTTTNKTGGVTRKLEDGDGVALVYSEPVTNLPTTLEVQLVGGNNNGNNNGDDALHVPGVFQAAAPVNSGYVTTNKTATATGTRATTDRTSTATLTISTCSGNSCAKADDMGQASASTLTFTQVTGLTDAAGNSLANRNLTPAATSISNFGGF